MLGSLMGPTPAEGHQNKQSPITMNTSDITQEQVVAWFASQIPAEYAGKIAVGYDTNYHKKFTAAPLPWEAGATEFADTLAEAVALIIVRIKSPEQIAAAKREKAAKLLAEADALAPIVEPSAERDEPDYDAPKPLTPMENYLQNDEHHVR